MVVTDANRSKVVVRKSVKVAQGASVSPTGRTMLKRDMIVELARKGLSVHEIAVNVGSTPGAVRVICCRARSDGTDIPSLRGRRTWSETITIQLSRDVFERLVNEGRSRGLDSPALCAAALLSQTLEAS